MTFAAQASEWTWVAMLSCYMEMQRQQLHNTHVVLPSAVTAATVTE